MKFTRAEITIRQMDAAIALLGWRILDLAKAAGLTPQCLSNMRAAWPEDDMLRPRRADTVRRIRATLEKHGIRFLRSGGVEPVNSRRKP